MAEVREELYHERDRYRDLENSATTLLAVTRDHFDVTGKHSACRKEVDELRAQVEELSVQAQSGT